ncbi:MAG: ATPase involved in chromosome partitioning [Candidatus Scalindua rubra]|uniref:ATPase involved in chromosome partitioning n=1 Tax=Candidatus Scalindua rubra TaxID=1872076 RepID=A0A1E3X565_9BACT|nr:MAG: ATPase involved in chromosome partitioning [Candidatus Scalindua rubra]
MRNRDDSESAKVIAFVHHKGGTGKTTSCLNIAGWLVKMKKKTLVVDLDPQGNATAGLGVDRNTVDGSIYDVLFGQKDIEETILETDSCIHLAPSSLDLLATETHMAGKVNNTTIIREKLGKIEKYFDYILIDVPPGSTLLMINGIIASENIIIPLDSGIFAYETMETLKTLLIDLDEEIGVQTNVMMALLKGYPISIFDRGPTREIKKLLKKFLTANVTSDVRIFTIPFSRKVYKAQMKGKPISHYAPHSGVGRAYRKIAKEILTIDD